MSWDIEDIVFYYIKVRSWYWYVWIIARLTFTKWVISPILSWHVKRKEAECYEWNHSAYTSTCTVTVGSSHSYTLYSLLSIIFIFFRHHINVNLLSKLSDSKPSFILLFCIRLWLLLFLVCSNMILLVFVWAWTRTFNRDLLHFEFSFFLFN